jgi:hypothetical protein
MFLEKNVVVRLDGFTKNWGMSFSRQWKDVVVGPLGNEAMYVLKDTSVLQENSLSIFSTEDKVCFAEMVVFTYSSFRGATQRINIGFLNFNFMIYWIWSYLADPKFSLQPHLFAAHSCCQYRDTSAFLQPIAFYTLSLLLTICVISFFVTSGKFH